MIDPEDAQFIDECLAEVPQLLQAKGFALVQRSGYKAGKLPSSRNWLQWNDGDVPLNIRCLNRNGNLKTWKLFARFGIDHAPSCLWDQPEPYERKKAQWMLAGTDVWGITYEDINRHIEGFTYEEFLKCLLEDLVASFAYSLSAYG